MVKAKLPQEVLLQLEIMNGANNKWTALKLIETLRDYVVAREKSEMKSKPSESNTRTFCAKYKPVNNHEQSHGDKTHGIHSDIKSNAGRRGPVHVTSAEALVASEKQLPVKNYFDKCRYCEKQHRNDEYPTYRTVKERKQQLKAVLSV